MWKAPATIDPRRGRWTTARCSRVFRAALLAGVAVVSSLPLAVGSAEAVTLKEALSAAYSNNPILKGERARLRGTDEEVARARSGYRPTVSANGEIEWQWTDTNPSSPSDGTINPKSYSLTVTQPIFRGYRTVNAVREAELTVKAARERLRLTEQDLLLSAVTVYMNVLRDQAIVQLRENNVVVLRREEAATQDRFAVGEVTRTDVSQAKARAALARSQLELANANLKSSRAAFERVVGFPPGNLRAATPIESLIPHSLDEAVEIAMGESPTVTSAVFVEQAAQRTVDRIYGEFLPEVNLEANYSQTFDPSRTINDREVATLTGRVRVPIYQAGEVSARVRQARQNADGRFMDIEQARLLARSEVIAAWSQLQSFRAQLESDLIRVEANQTALTGVREEQRVGQRTLLDVLDAEQELLDAQVAIVGTRRDLVVSSYALLAAIGRLSAADLSLGVQLHDSEEYLELVREKWWGTTVVEEVVVDDTGAVPTGSGGWTVEIETRSE
ncbi:MAG: TolC family outer membrane protein [Rhizobiales bacterium]|nr:TolC family outer membrane protein [Hyphomicrobiales bacterium]